MPFPRNHLLLTAIGDAWTANEIWTFGLRVDRAAPATAAEGDALVAAYTTYHQAAGSAVSFRARLLGVKVAVIGVDGRYPPETDATEHLAAVPVLGSSQGASVPQSTLAVSLRTAVTRGRGNRGRFYPPATTFFSDADGRITAPQAQGAANAAAALVNAVQDALGAPVVVGSTLAVSLRPVTFVEVGRVIDTMRSRRSALEEDHQGANVAPFVPAP